MAGWRVCSNTADARRWFRGAAEIYREIGDRRFELVARSDLGHALRRSGELDEAEELYRETLGEWQRMGNRGAIANQLESFAFIALARHDDCERCSYWLAPRRSGSRRTADAAARRDGVRRGGCDAASEIDGEVLTAAWQKGGAMSLS